MPGLGVKQMPNQLQQMQEGEPRGAPAKGQANPRQDDTEDSQARLPTQGSVSCAGRQHKRSA